MLFAVGSAAQNAPMQLDMGKILSQARDLRIRLPDSPPIYDSIVRMQVVFPGIFEISWFGK
jgi:hypothetical protein